MKFRNNLVSKLSRLLKNLQLSRFQLGMMPIVTKVFKPWMDRQGSACSFLSLLAAAASSPSRLTASAWHEQTWWSQRLSKSEDSRAVGKEGLSPGCDPFCQFCYPLRACLFSDLGKAARIISGSQGLFYFYQFLSQLCTCLNIYRHAKEGTWFMEWHSALTLGTCWSAPPPPPVMTSFMSSPLILGDFIYPTSELPGWVFTESESHTDCWGNCKERTRRLFKGRKGEVLVLFWQPADTIVLLILYECYLKAFVKQMCLLLQRKIYMYTN